MITSRSPLARHVVTTAALALALSSSSSRAVDKGEEVEITAGAVTALSCALEMKKTGDLSLLSSCPLGEVTSGIVVVDVAEQEIYVLSDKKVLRSELESAFAGGSIDLTATVARVDKKKKLPVLDVSDYTISKKPKPGAFKGCL